VDAGDNGLNIDSIEQVDNRGAVAFSWADRDDNRHEWAQVLTIENGGIADVQDHPDAASARKSLRRSGQTIVAAVDRCHRPILPAATCSTRSVRYA
jgi:hypothetical protein